MLQGFVARRNSNGSIGKRMCFKLKKGLVYVVLWVAFFLFAGNVEANGSSFVVIDAQNGRTLMGTNEHSQLEIASLTKIWTALVVLEHSDLTEQVFISERLQLRDHQFI